MKQLLVSKIWNWQERKTTKCLICSMTNIEMLHDRNEGEGNGTFRCKECRMEFADKAHLERHFRAAHPTKHEGFRQKWYWES